MTNSRFATLAFLFVSSAHFGGAAKAVTILESYTDINQIEPSNTFWNQGPPYSERDSRQIIECDEIDRRYKRIVDLKREQTEKLQERSIAINNSDAPTAEKLDAKLLLLDMELKQNVVMQRMLEDEPLHMMLSPIPASDKIRFLMAQSDTLSLRPLRPLLGKAVYKEASSVLPLKIVWSAKDPFLKLGTLERTRQFAKIQAPAPRSDNYLSIDPYSSEYVSAPISLVMEAEPYWPLTHCDSDRQPCSVYFYTILILDVTQGQLCRSATDRVDSAARAAVADLADIPAQSRPRRDRTITNPHGAGLDL